MVNSKEYTEIFDILFDLARHTDGGTDALHKSARRMETVINERCKEAIEDDRRNVGQLLGGILGDLLANAD